MYVPSLDAEDPERIARNVRDRPFATGGPGDDPAVADETERREPVRR